MAEPTPSLRDQGRQALQAGNLDAAVDFLSRAVMASDADTDAKMMLGIAYSMKGLHAQAKRALEGAVAGAPQNPDYRFNLGMVLEKAGDVQGAAQAFRATLQINPQHPQARAKLQALGPQAGYGPPTAPPVAPAPPAAPPPTSTYGALPPSATYGAPPTWGPPPGSPAPPQQPQAPPPYGQPLAGGGLPGMPPSPIGQPPMGAAPLGGLPPLGQPPIGGAPLGGLPPIGQPPIGQPGMAPPPPLGGPPPMGAPIGGPSMGGPPMGAIPGMAAPQAPEGMVQCPRCGQFTRPGMLCDMCSTPLPPPTRQVSSTGPAAFGTIGPTPEYKPAPAPRVGFKDGFAQWWEVLTGPRAFFEEQANREGLNEPSTFIMVWCVVVSIILTIVEVVVAHNFHIQGIFCQALMLWLFVMAFMHIWAVSIHGLSRLFGGQGSYSGSFRVAAYSSAPSLLALVFFFIALSTLPKSAGMAAALPSPQAQPQIQAGLAQFGAPPQSGMPRYGSPQFGVPPQPGVPPQFGTPGRPGFQPGGGFSNGLPGGNRPGISPEQAAQILGSLGWAFAILLIGSMWSTILAGIGIAHVHDVGTGQAVFAVILASLLYNLLVGLIVGLVAATLGVAIMGAAQMISGGRH